MHGFVAAQWLNRPEPAARPNARLASLGTALNARLLATSQRWIFLARLLGIY